MEHKKDILKVQLVDNLIMNKVFWSYSDIKADDISDDILIEKTLINLDIEDINKLFLIFPQVKIRNIWNEKVVIKDAQFHSMNLLFAHLYFNIKNPESYLERYLNKHYKKLHLS